MPSRKKAKGQARKAAKVKTEAAEKAKEVEESFRALEQAQIQRLQISNQYSVLPLLRICMHGFDPFPNDTVCNKFIRTFVHEYYKWLCKMYKAGRKVERAVIVCLLQIRESTKDEYFEVWNSSAKLKQVISYFLHSGTMLILDEKVTCARDCAVIARFFEQWLKVKVHKYQSCIDWLKV